MENTTENKSRFFALYYGQKILKVSPDAVVTQAVDGYFLSKLYSTSFLSLRSISSLTDEEAKCLSSIWYPGLPQSDPRLIPWGKHIASLLKDWNLALRELRFNQAEHMISYLRSIGILIPLMDLSVEQIIEYGWAKEDTSC